MRIKNVMSHPVITCSTASTARAAAKLMWEHDCGIIPVVDNEGRLAGVVTDRDLCMAAYMQGKALDSIPVTAPMSKDVLSCHMDDSVDAVERAMREGQVRRIPIVDDHHRPVGVVTVNDLARLAAQAKRSNVDREVVSTLAAICEPRHAAAASAASSKGIVTA